MAHRSLALSLVLFACLAPLSAHAQCRDDAGEPIACPTPPVTPEAEPERAPTPYEREGGYVEWGVTFEVLDLRRLHLTAQRPEWLPELARDVMVHGAAAPSDIAVGGLSLVLGARPVPFLRFPELSIQLLGAADLTNPMIGAQPEGALTASIDSILVLRARLGAGLEAHVGPVGFFATGRVGIAGYFAEARLAHAWLGDFGRAQLAEDALELGWELAIAWDVEPGWSLKGTVEGTHFGADSIGSSFRIVGTF